MGNLGISLHLNPLGRSITVSLLLTPVYAVMGFFAPWHNQRNQHHPLLTSLPAASTASSNPGHSFNTKAANNGHFTPTPLRPASPEQCPHRLRVLRVTDASCTAHSAGRMMISGRFSEVCAELDRLSQQDAA